MNAPRKKAAVAAYQSAFDEGKDVVSLLKADEKNYTDDEITEIIGAFEVKGKKVITGSQKYECWKAKPVYKFSISEETGEKEKKLEKVEKIGEKPISTHSMEERHADILNAQVDNSGVYYFTAK